jgi:hypothetical protein
LTHRPAAADVRRVRRRVGAPAARLGWRAEMRRAASAGVPRGRRSARPASAAGPA